MTDQDEFADNQPDGADDGAPDNFYIDILTGNKESVSAKKLLIQKVLRQLLESYGFDRTDIEVNYNPQISGHGRKRIDIAIFRPDTEHNNDNLQRLIICKPQKARDKLRSISEADADLRELKELLELIPSATLGMWTNDQEEFLFQVEHTRFEVRTKPLGVWPAPGEATADLGRTGGVIQVSAEAEGLEDALMRCRRYLNRNLGLDHKDSFKQLAVLMLAKIYDETLPNGDRRFWIRGDEPFTVEGQQAIALRINDTITAAKIWQPNLLTRGWDLTLAPNETARVVMELARYSLSETQPRYRTKAFRAVARNVMDGREGRYPTPLNVAEMAVDMLDPQPNDRIMDCSSGTGTFLAMTAAHIFKKKLAAEGTSVEEATNEQIRQVQNETVTWTANNILGCEIDPFLAVTSRMNLLFTIGDPGRVFRIDARTFPRGDLDGIEAARPALHLGSMDIVFLNPWFSTKEVISDESILSEHDLGKLWNKDESTGDYINSGAINTAGIPPEVLFIERALAWVKPGTGRVGILLPDGLLGNSGDEYIRWWILRNCEVLASIDLPLEPFKVTTKEYGLSPALASLLVLRRRSNEELINAENLEYKIFMAVVGQAGEDTRGPLFHRAPDGEVLIFDEETIERVRNGSHIEIRRATKRGPRIHDDLPLVAKKYLEFRATGDVSL